MRIAWRQGTAARLLCCPGMMGRIGTLLGDAGINIARLQLGVARERSGEALGILNVDSPVPHEVAERMRAVPGILAVTNVALDR